MTVKEVFELRLQGKVEEAYEAIRPMYAAHKGRYTTLCMFWTACDVFKLRLEQKRVEEAEKIYEALKRMLPQIEVIEDSDDQAASKREESQAKEQARQEGKARGFMRYAEGRLIKESDKFRKRYFAIKDWKKKRKHRDPLGAQTQDPKVNLGIDEGRKEEDLAGNEGINLDRHSCNNPSDNPSEEVTKEPEGIRLQVPDSILLDGQISLERTGKQEEVVAYKLNSQQRKVLNCIQLTPGNSIPKLSKILGIPSKSLERHIAVLADNKLIEHRGSKKTGGYFAVIRFGAEHE